MSPPFLMGAPFNPGIRWTGWWTGDAYDDGTGVAIGQPSAGPSGGRNLSGGVPPPRILDTGNGHHYWKCRRHGFTPDTGATSTWLSTGIPGNLFIGDGSQFLFYAVLRMLGAQTITAGANLPLIMYVGGGALRLGDSISASGPIPDYIRSTAAGSPSGGLETDADNGVGYELDKLFLYEVYLDPKEAIGGNYYLKSSINGSAATFLTDASGPIVITGSPTAEMFTGLEVAPGVPASLVANVYEVRITDLANTPEFRAHRRAELMAKYGITP